MEDDAARDAGLIEEAEASVGAYIVDLHEPEPHQGNEVNLKATSQGESERGSGMRVGDSDSGTECSGVIGLMRGSGQNMDKG